MNSPAKDIANMLDGDSGLGLTLLTDLFYSRMVSDPQNAVAVFDTGGANPMLQYNKARSQYYYPSINIQVRNVDYDAGHAVATAIRLFLHGERAITVGDTYYALIKSTNEPQLLHYDENDRAVFIINFDIQRKTI
jgi:hypothetical protein